MHDVIVVGAGPAGLAAAEAVAQMRRRVVILDRSAGIGVPVRTSGGSFIRPLRKLGLPRRLWHPIHRIRLIGPDHDLTFGLRRPLACVLDVRETYQWLAAQAADQGAEIRLRSAVRAPLLEDGRVQGVLLANDEAVRSRLVIDASGYRGVLSERLGLQPGSERRAIGHEVEAYAPHYDQDEAVLIVGDDVAPGGYGWAFPCGAKRVRLGVGVVRPDSTADPAQLLSMLVDRVPALRRSCAPMGALEMHAGVMPALDPRRTPLSGPGLLIAGDAAGQGSTLIGEGIRHAISGGRLAGQAAGRALAAGTSDGEVAALEAYRAEWQRTHGRQMSIAYELHLRVCRYRDEDWSRILDMVRHIRPGQVARALAGDLTPVWALRTLVTSPQIIRSGRSLLRAALASDQDRATSAP